MGTFESFWLLLGNFGSFWVNLGAFGALLGASFFGVRFYLGEQGIKCLLS